RLAFPRTRRCRRRDRHGALRMIDENLLWLLSSYRTSEISGALFFGQLARRLKPGAIQMDMTAHFADEAQHARYWTDCIAELSAAPLKLDASDTDNALR